MNHKAVELGMWRTRFVDGTGLSSENVSTAQDLARLVGAAYRQPLIREYTTDIQPHRRARQRPAAAVSAIPTGWSSNAGWDIGLSKTGYISEAGRCLVMQAKIAAQPVIIVLLDSWGKLTRIGDANRIKKWIESQSLAPAGGLTCNRRAVSGERSSMTPLPVADDSANREEAMDQRGPRFAFHDRLPDAGSFLDDVIAGLSRPQKALPPKYFYDERGCALFEAICELPEYYLTRTETRADARAGRRRWRGASGRAAR